MRAEHSTRASLWFWCCAALSALALLAWSFGTGPATVSDAGPGTTAADPPTTPTRAVDLAAAEPDRPAPSQASPAEPGAASALEPRELHEAPGAAAAQPEPTGAASRIAHDAPFKPSARGPALESLRSQVSILRPGAGHTDSRLSKSTSSTRAANDACGALREQQRQRALSEEEQALLQRACASR